MHLIFLGVTSSLFELTNSFYLRAALGKGDGSFKQNIQGLLNALVPFTLSWLLAHPFSVSASTQLTTST